MLMAKVVRVLIFRVNKAGQRPPDQMTSLSSQQCSHAEIGLQYYPFFIESDITNRGQVLEVKIFFAGCFQFLLDSAQFFVLHLKFDLVHTQLVD